MDSIDKLCVEPSWGLLGPWLTRPLSSPHYGFEEDLCESRRVASRVVLCWCLFAANGQLICSDTSEEDNEDGRV